MLAPLSRAVSKTLGPYTPNERSQRRYFSRRGNQNTPTARRGSLATAKSTRPTALAVTVIPAEDAAAIADAAGADADASSSSTAELAIPPKHKERGSYIEAPPSFGDGWPSTPWHAELPPPDTIISGSWDPSGDWPSAFKSLQPPRPIVAPLRLSDGAPLLLPPSRPPQPPPKPSQQPEPPSAPSLLPPHKPSSSCSSTTTTASSNDDGDAILVPGRSGFLRAPLQPGPWPPGSGSPPSSPGRTTHRIPPLYRRKGEPSEREGLTAEERREQRREKLREDTRKVEMAAAQAELAIERRRVPVRRAKAADVPARATEAPAVEAPARAVSPRLLRLATGAPTVLEIRRACLSGVLRSVL